jgi:hypothetical protein
MITIFRIIASFSIPLLISFSTSHEQKIDNKNSPHLLFNNKERKHIMLLGASIGRAWDISSLPGRIGNHDYIFEYVDEGGFDKSKKLKEILSRLENKPDAIFLKECAAYFPGDFENYKSLMKQWITDCYKAGVIPIPTTVVPVTKLHSSKKFGIDILKLRNPFKLGSPFRNKRQNAILEYNDWIRKYCANNGLTVLDLEQAVCKSKKNRYLKSGLAKVDGLHLNKKGYQSLDKIVIPTLEEVNWEIRK